MNIILMPFPPLDLLIAKELFAEDFGEINQHVSLSVSVVTDWCPHSKRQKSCSIKAVICNASLLQPCEKQVFAAFSAACLMCCI